MSDLTANKLTSNDLNKINNDSVNKADMKRIIVRDI
jgi:hypothetical protein